MKRRDLTFELAKAHASFRVPGANERKLMKLKIDAPPIPWDRALLARILSHHERFAVAGWLASRGWAPVNGGIALWENDECRVPETIYFALKIEANRAAFEPLGMLGWRITDGSRSSHGVLRVKRVRVGGHEGTGPHYSLIGALKKERLI